jgi:hypothetical protein
MVCKVISGKSIKGALNYNESKVREGLAECISAVNFIAEPEQLNFYDKLSRFENLIEKNKRAKTNAVHISLNFDVSEKLDKNVLNDIASTYMNTIGFGDQPYLVYQHHDAAHPHVHIVTTNIQEGGRRISIHNIGKLQSEKARKEIEIQYRLVQAQYKPRQTEPLLLKVDKAIYGKSETKRSISNIVCHVTRRYKFSSLPELNAVLRQYNVVADRGKEGMKMYDKNGLLYSFLDGQGNKIGVPIKASAVTGNPTLKSLQNKFELNRILKAPHKDRLLTIIDSFFSITRNHTKADFCDYMKFHEVQALFLENKDGIIYGLTFIDNKTSAVFKGSDLGKDYSCRALIQKMSPVQTNMSGVPHYEVKRSSELPQLDMDWMTGFTNTILELMKSEKVYAENVHLQWRRKRKKKRRPRL